MRTSLSLFLLAVTIVGCSSNTSRSDLNGTATGTPSSTDLPAGITAFSGIDPSIITDDSDLEPIAKIIGNASAVGLGESIHTSGGYHEAKFRIIRYLVETMGFRVFAMETPRLQAQAAVEYVASCSGTSDDALKSIFGVFASTTTKDLFDWLCQYNKAHPSDPVRFLGFDMQEPAQQMQSIAAFLSQTAPQDAASLTGGLTACNGAAPSSSSNSLTQISVASRSSCESSIAKVLQYMGENRSTLVLASSLETFTLTQLSLRGMNAWEDEMYYQYSQPQQEGASFAARDQGMADALTSLKKLWFPNAKAIIWAHNFHLEKAEDQDKAYGLTIKNMGEYLSEAWGSDYAPFGLVSYQTDINWPESDTSPRCQSFPPPSASNSVEKMLHDLNNPFLLVDLASMKTAPNPFFSPGGIYQYDPAESMSVTKVDNQYNGLIYLEHSAAMNSTEWGDCNPGSSGFSPVTTPVPLPPPPSIAGDTMYKYSSWSCGGKDVLQAATSVGFAALYLALGTNAGAQIYQISDGCQATQAVTVGFPNATTLTLTTGAVTCSSSCSATECQASAAPSPAQVAKYSYSQSANALTLVDAIDAGELGGGPYATAGCSVGDVETIVATKQ